MQQFLSVLTKFNFLFQAPQGQAGASEHRGIDTGHSTYMGGGGGGGMQFQPLLINPIEFTHH